MGDNAQRETDVNRAPNQAATGWDPYQVWLTRIRQQQRLLESRSAETVTPQRSWSRTRAIAQSARFTEDPG